MESKAEIGVAGVSARSGEAHLVIDSAALAAAREADGYQWRGPKGEGEILDELAPGDVWLIWSNEQRQWWRPGRAGYTLEVDQAGRYSRQEAGEVVSRLGVGEHKGCTLFLAPECVWHLAPESVWPSDVQQRFPRG